MKYEKMSEKVWNMKRFKETFQRKKSLEKEKNSKVKNCGE